MNDLRRMLSLLSGEGLLSTGMLAPVRYVDNVESAAACVVQNLIDLVMTDKIQTSVGIRSYMFSVLMKGRLTSATDFIERMSRYIEGNGLDCSVSDEGFTTVYQEAVSIRDEAGIEMPFDPPDILWLPVEYHPRFEPSHGVSDYILRHGGSCVLLCAPEYYYQILWHECFHLLFGATDCYDLNSHQGNCSLVNCVMQWNPCFCHPEDGRWYCDRQKDAIKRGVKALEMRRDRLIGLKQKGAQ